MYKNDSSQEDRMLQMEVLSIPASVTFREWLRFQMYTLESEYLEIKDPSIRGVLQVKAGDKISNEVHVEIYRDHVELNVRLLIGYLKKIEVDCDLQTILSAKVIMDQRIGKTHREFAVATFILMIDIDA